MRLLAENLGIDRAGRRILSGVSFDLSGGALALTGPNGIGKSSLLRVLAGLLPASAGRVLIEGVAEPATAIHYVGHRDGLKPQLTVRENLAFVAEFLGAPDIMPNPLEALAAFAMEGAADVPVAWLSAGQRRRVALARLILVPRPLWLLDEPLTGLDAAAVARFEALAASHVATGGLLVAATHAALACARRELRLGTSPRAMAAPAHDAGVGSSP